MRWIEVSIETPESEIDRRCEELTELGCSGFIIENEADFRSFLENNHQYWDYVDESLEQKYSGLSRIKCYLPDDDGGRRLLSAIADAGFMPQTATVEDSDWENNWRQYYKPLPIGEKLIVVPEWEDAGSTGRIPLRLDPGLLFGTGTHATTRMCLESLESFAGAGKRVLDLGCGSGILGIGAAVLGCESFTGVDIDPKAPDTVTANASLNGIPSDAFRVFAGDITGDKPLRQSLGTGYDIVLANIVSDVIIALAPHVRGFMADGGVFISSGIIDGRENEVCAALKASGFSVEDHLHEDGWHCFVCRHSQTARQV